MLPVVEHSDLWIFSFGTNIHCSVLIRRACCSQWGNTSVHQKHGISHDMAIMQASLLLSMAFHVYRRGCCAIVPNCCFFFFFQSCNNIPHMADLRLGPYIQFNCTKLWEQVSTFYFSIKNWSSCFYINLQTYGGHTRFGFII